MNEIPKRLQNSLNRIKRCGGIILIHHTSQGATDYQLQSGKSVAPPRRSQAITSRPNRIRSGWFICRMRADISCGERMNKFVEDIQARLAIINQMIPSTNKTERRALQKERADLEEKLRKVTT